MKIINSLSTSINYGMTNVDHTIKKIAGNPSAVKKILHLTIHIFAAFDLAHTGKIREREITHVMKGATDVIKFYGSYKNLMYWVNLFSKEGIDQEALKQSIDASLCASHIHDKRQKIIANEVFDEVMRKDIYYSKSEVLNEITSSLVKHGYPHKKAELIAARIIVQQKARSSTELFYMACLSVADLGSTVLVLKKWDILDLSHIAASIGSQSRVCLFVINLGTHMVLGSIASAGLAVYVGETSYQAITHGMQLYSAESERNKEKAYQELRRDLINLFEGVVDLTATAAPMIFALNPAALIALAIISKGTGIVCFLNR